MKILILDTETTGVDTAEDHICEVGMELREYGEGGQSELLEAVEFLAKPPVPIPFEAMGVHHITNEKVADKPPIEHYKETVGSMVDRADFICAHNLPFDYAMLVRPFPEIFEPLGKNVHLDTLRLARKVFSELPSYSLNVLRYRFKLDAGLTGEAHRALFDVGMCRNLLNLCLEKEPMDFEDIPEFIAAPMILKLMPFGKHQGMEIPEMLIKESGYVKWLIRQTWFETERPDLFYTIQQLKKH